jgi:precorrin-3B synthase
MTGRRGWCPTLFEPMQSGDGLLVRVKPPFGSLSAAAARSLAAAAALHGNGIIELTNRGNLQVRGLAPQSVGRFAAAIISAGLASTSEQVERRRNLIVSPLLDDDPSLAPETGSIAGAIERGLAREPRFASLPRKFGILVDGGGVLPLAGVRADIAVRSIGDDFALLLDGEKLAGACAPEQAAAIALGLALAFLDRAVDPRPSGSDPTRAHADTSPSCPGVTRASHPLHGERNSWMAGPRTSHSVLSATRNPIGYVRYPGLDRGAFGLGVPFGEMAAATLAGLADLASRYGAGTLRITPWRALMLAGVAEADVPGLSSAAERAGVIVDPADRRLRLVACPGGPACVSASVAARADAARLAAMGVPTSGLVHVSGCRKGCAHRGAAALTLVGAAGSYGLVRNGAAADIPAVTGLTITQAADLLRLEFAA